MKLITALLITGIGISVTIHVPGDYPTIQEGLNAAANGDTVLVAPGTYVENVFLPTGNTLLSESGPDLTIIDGSDPEPPYPLWGSALICFAGGTIDGFTLAYGGGTDPTGVGNTCGGGVYIADAATPLIRNCVIRNNSANWGGGVCLFGEHCRPTLVNNVIKNNVGNYGSGIMLYENSGGLIAGNLIDANFGCSGIATLNVEDIATIRNNVITHHNPYGFASYSWTSCDNIDLVNNTFADNIKGILYSSSSGNVINCIFFNFTHEIYATDNSLVFINHSDIEQGSTGIVCDSTSRVYLGYGIIDEDPLFEIGSNPEMYYLQPSSPCIDAGHPALIWNDPEDPYNPGMALWPSMGTVRCDMGAYGGPGANVWTEEYQQGIPGEELMLSASLSCHPNPFTSSLRINYIVSEPSMVNLRVYNLAGHLIETIVYDSFITGVQQVIWNPDESIPEGIYFLVLDVNSTRINRKCVKLQ